MKRDRNVISEIMVYKINAIIGLFIKTVSYPSANVCNVA